MATHRARPRSLFSFAFDILDGDRPVAHVRHRLFRRLGDVVVGDTDYEVVRIGPASWAMEQRGVPGEVVTARRPTLFRTRYELQWPGGSATLVRSGLGYRMSLLDAGNKVGSIRLRNLFARTLIVDTPETMPLTAVALLVWITIRMRRAAAAAAGGGA